jgi:glutamate 5-kinase
LATLQAAAAVGQTALVDAYAGAFARHGLTVGQVLLTADDVVRRSHYRNARVTLDRLLDLGVIPVINENDTVATAEIRFGDNDRLAALVAHLVDADRLLLLSDVDALYTTAPGRAGARLIPEITVASDLAGVDLRGTGSGVGSGGMRSKVEAAQMAAASGVPTVVGAAEGIVDLLAERGGTVFHPTGPRSSSRLRWLAHAASPRGRLLLDAGAVAAVVDRRASLLPAGITSVEGDFAAGDPVELIAPGGRAVARGITGYDAADLPPLLGRSTREAGAREVVHADDLVVLAVPR